MTARVESLFSLEDLIFDEVIGVYRHRTIERPFARVTRTLEEHRLGFAMAGSEIPAVIAGAVRGTFVHKATALLERGELDVEELAAQDPEAAGYVESYARTVELTKARAVMVERPIYSPSWWYAGTPDRVMTYPDGRRRGVDLKTGDSTDVDAQVGAYDLACRAWWVPFDSWDVWTLHASGKAATIRRIEGLELRRGTDLFLACLTISARWNEKLGGRR